MIVRLYKDIVETVVKGLLEFQREDAVTFELATGTPNHTGQQLLDLLMKVVNEEPAERDLIDQIVGVLRLPYTGNRFSTGTLDRLRQALMLPSELAAFTSSVNEHWQCAVCTHPLEHGEMVTVRREASGQIVVRCSNCAVPELVACADGKHHKSLGRALQQKLQRAGSGCLACEEEVRRASVAAERPGLVSTAAVTTSEATTVSNARGESWVTAVGYAASPASPAPTAPTVTSGATWAQEALAMPAPPPPVYRSISARLGDAAASLTGARSAAAQEPNIIERSRRYAELQAIEREILRQNELTNILAPADPVDDYLADDYDDILDDGGDE